MHAVGTSTKHAEPLEPFRLYEGAGLSSAKMAAPDFEEMDKFIEAKAVRVNFLEIRLNNNLPLQGDHAWILREGYRGQPSG